MEGYGRYGSLKLTHGGHALVFLQQHFHLVDHGFEDLFGLGRLLGKVRVLFSLSVRNDVMELVSTFSVHVSNDGDDRLFVVLEVHLEERDGLADEDFDELGAKL